MRDNVIFVEKCLSVKVLINKEDFKFVGGFLMRWEFDFLVMMWVKCLILVGFDDIGYDKWFEMGKLGFFLILVGFWWLGEVRFLSWCRDESAIGSAAFPVLPVSFNYPWLGKNSV